jgi:hypothetical protein
MAELINPNEKTKSEGFTGGIIIELGLWESTTLPSREGGKDIPGSQVCYGRDYKLSSNIHPSPFPRNKIPGPMTTGMKTILLSSCMDSVINWLGFKQWG